MLHHSDNYLQFQSQKNRYGDRIYSRSSPVLSWRLDPEDSLSDWTISVVSSPDLEETDAKYLDRYDTSAERDVRSTRRSSHEKSTLNHNLNLSLTKVYFVHRAQLAVGPRKSEFFFNLFRKEKSKPIFDSDSSESSIARSKNYTKIELIPQAASCFPIMLDYLYSTEGTPLAITTESAVALRRLASSFGMRAMFKETTEFIKKDLTPNTATTYLLDAKRFKNHKLKDSAMEIIAYNFLSIQFSSLVRIPTDLMKEIIQSGKFEVEDEAKFSCRVAAYCRCREDEINVGILNCYTNASIISTVDDSEALYFLHFLFVLREKEYNTTNIESMNLYQLCMLKVPKVLGNLHISKSLSSDSFDKATVRKQKHDLELYNNLPAETKVQLLERSFESSQAPAPEIFIKSSHAPPFNGIDRKAKKQVDLLQKQVNQLKLSYEKKVTYYQRMLEAKVEELRRFSDDGDDDETNGPLQCSPINILRNKESSVSSSRISDMRGSSMS